jgi:hypothetical protein
MLKSQPRPTRSKVLYNSNDMEPHVALQIIEKIVRLMQPAAADDSAQVSAGSGAGYEKNQKPEDKVCRDAPTATCASLTVSGSSRKVPPLPCGMDQSGI